MCMGVGAKVTHQLRLGMAVGGNGLSVEMMLKTSNDAQISTKCAIRLKMHEGKLPAISGLRIRDCGSVI